VPKQKTAKPHKALRAEVIHQESGPPVDAIDEFLESRDEDLAAATEVERETLEVPVDVLNRLLPDRSIPVLKEQLERDAEAEKDAKKAEAKHEKAKNPSDMMEAADLHSNYPQAYPDPVQPPLVESSNVDTAAQQMEAAEAAAVPLREAVSESLADRPENGSQHYEAGKAADKGEIYPPEPEAADVTLNKRNKATDKAYEKNADEAVKRFKAIGKKNENHLVVAHRREDTPTRPEQDILDDEYYGDALIHYSQPVNGAVNVGTLVSRQDEEHEEIGVVTEVDTSNMTHPLVLVYFDAKEQLWLSPSNLVNEGDVFELAEKIL
jgi:hypothetical protein